MSSSSKISSRETASTHFITNTLQVRIAAQNWNWKFEYDGIRQLRDLRNALSYQITILWDLSHYTIFYASALDYDKCIQTDRILENKYLGFTKEDEGKTSILKYDWWLYPLAY